MKVVAYEIEWDICWEPGMPDLRSPDYYKAEENSYRNHCREVGMQYDADIISSEILDPKKFTSYLWTAPKLEASQQSIMNTRFNMEKPVCFCASLNLLEYLDFPYNDMRWPIMSKQMVETLKEVGEFRHHTYPTIMEDNEIHRGMGTTGLRMQDFLIVQTLEFLDPYNWEDSEYVIEKSIDWDGTEEIIADFTKLVLREPLPPFFRLNGNATSLYISAAAKEALQVSNTARGAYFPPVDEEYRIKLPPYYPIPKEYLKNIIDV
jgi:hypothetical protein